VKDIFRTFNSGRAIFFLMIFICCVLAAVVLKMASMVVLPFTIAIMLAFALYPLIKWMEKFHFPRFLSISVVIIIMIIGLYIFGMVLFTSGKTIFSFYPKYESRLTEIYIWLADILDLPYNEDLSFFQNLWGQLGIRTWVRNFTLSFSNIFLKFLTSAILVVLSVSFLLVEASNFKEKLEMAFENRKGSITKIGNDLMSQVTRYLAAKFLISLANGIIFTVAFYLIGLEFAIVWGVIQFVLNFIPTLGSIVSGVAMSLFALIQFWPEPAPVILVVVIILAVNLILGNILDPKIIGEHVGVSPLIVLVSLGIWGWIWGFAGMIIAVPMTVIIKIICENIPIMEPVSILIGSRKAVKVKAKKSENEKIET
jgi:predicted PurR-regulated permease PerM